MIKVVDVKPLENYELLLEFNNGEKNKRYQTIFRKRIFF